MTPETRKGKVFLVGAGPGSPELLTLKAINCLKQATVVLYDYLVSEEILQHCSPEAETIFVGKKAGEHTFTQEEINILLCQKALAGETVVRLKGGDPFLLGRGGEEAMVLAENGIEFEVVPGVSSALAAPAYAGIPITHRDYSSSVHIFTGHQRDANNGELALDWQTIARLKGTLVFLMGRANLSQIAEGLIRYGKPENTPVALIYRATFPEQRTFVSTLDKIAEIADAEDVHPPVVIVIGECVRLREKINWLENRPLFGKRILITRPEEQCEGFAHLLTSYGATPLLAPVITIVPLENNRPLWKILDSLAEFDWLLFASVNSVKVFMQELYARGKDLRVLDGLKIGTIGSRTAEYLYENWKIKPDFVPSEFVQESLAGELPATSGQKVLIPRASTSRDILPLVLRQKGLEVEVIPVYEIAPNRDGIKKAKHLLAEKKVDVITFTASSVVRFLLENIRPDHRESLFSGVRIASIGPITSKTIRDYGLPVHIEAREFTTESLIQEIIRYYKFEKS